MGLKIVKIAWSEWKACAARPNVSTYYVQYASTYEVVAIDNHFVYQTVLLTATEISDFVTNYKSAATSVVYTGDAIADANKIEIVKISGSETANAVTNPIYTRFSDGTNPIGVTGNPFFVNVKDGSGAALTSTSSALDINIKSVTGTNLPISIAAQSLAAVAISKNNTANAVGNAVFVQFSDGSAALGTTGNPIFVNNKDGAGNALTSTSGKLDVGLTGANTVKLTDSAGTAITLSGGNLKTSLFDASGNVAIATKGSAFPGTAGVVIVGGSDGTNTQAMTLVLKDTAFPSSTYALMVGGSDGTNTRLLSTPLDAAANPSNLRGLMISGTDGTNTRVLRTNTSGQAISESHNYDGAGNSITSTTGPTGVRGLDVSIQTLIANPADHVFVFGTVTTTVTGTKSTIVSYTVPAGKDFLFLCLQSSKNNSTAVGAVDFSLDINGSAKVKQMVEVPSNSVNTVFWTFEVPFPVKIATAGDVITVAVIPNANISSIWSATLAGYLRNT